jgi:hypothetical protein
MLENKTLAKTPVPDVNLWSSSEKKKLLTLVDRRLRADGEERDRLSAEIDSFVSDAYGLSASERRALGIEEVRA